ncbi:hypothetical protein NXF25_011914 [Crotalus adamanteus]|uniref:CCHC-type domain-containing protein n=1 Tax=Crotalus adamanteus TaxID=8729 RepID=A0AAW1BGF9_CROAD
MARAINIEQGKEESPATFLQRLKDGLRKYAGADPDDALNVQLVKIQFVTKAWPDIAKKLQKRENWTAESLEVLLREAQKIYVNREEEKVKRDGQRTSRMMAIAVKEVMQVQPERGRGRGWERGRGRGSEFRGRPGMRSRGGMTRGRMVRERGTCFHCGKMGHFKRECPTLASEEQINRMMEEDEDIY